jgi:methylated-DNA-protein-cysteine methyltransferase-like protein
MPSTGSVFELVYSVVRRIPRGKVLTYGQVARQAGMPNGARQVGYAMAAAPDDVPWQRVVGKSRRGTGRVLLGDAVLADLQRQLLEAEGVGFTSRDEIDLSRYGGM